MSEMKKTVCVDLDGVLAEYDGWKGVAHIGDPLPGAVEFTHKLSKIARVVIVTTRASQEVNGHAETVHQLAKRVEAWLQKHGFAFDEVYTGQGKPLAAAYIDDRAVPCRPQEEGRDEYETVFSIVRTVLDSCDVAENEGQEMSRNEELVSAVVDAISERLEQSPSLVANTERQTIYEWSVGRKWLLVTFWPDHIHWVWELDGASATGSIPVSPKAIADAITRAQ